LRSLEVENKADVSSFIQLNDPNDPNDLNHLNDLNLLPLSSINFYPVKYFEEISEADLTGAINLINMNFFLKLSTICCQSALTPDT
jgi:hypothetical protein